MVSILSKSSTVAADECRRPPLLSARFLAFLLCFCRFRFGFAFFFFFFFFFFCFFFFLLFFFPFDVFFAPELPLVDVGVVLFLSFRHYHNPQTRLQSVTITVTSTQLHDKKKNNFVDTSARTIKPPLLDHRMGFPSNTRQAFSADVLFRPFDGCSEIVDVHLRTSSLDGVHE